MPKLSKTVPKYRHHKASGRAVVTINGRDIYLGLYGSEESRQAYDRLIAEYLAQGRRHPDSEPIASGATPPGGNIGTSTSAASGDGLTINELFVRYWDEHVVHYYRKQGRPTSEQANIAKAMRPLVELYGEASAAGFGPLALKTYRQKLIDLGRCRTAINRDVGRVKQMFKWGGEEEILPPSVYHNLRCVSGLKRGRSQARETEPVQPVPEERIEAVLPHLAPQVQSMVRLQLLTGMRPGEVVIMRTCDIDTSGDIWEYRPDSHKTEHHGKQRVIYFGPRAQRELEPWLRSTLYEYLFSPREAVEALRERRRAQRKTPSNANRSGKQQKRGGRRAPTARYTTDNYGQAIAYGCERAFPPPDHLKRQRVPAQGRKKERWETPEEWNARLGETGWEALKAWRAEHWWSPGQLRHNAATYLRKQFGIEAARTVLGHSSATATEVYAELDFAKAMQIMGEVG